MATTPVNPIPPAAIPSLPAVVNNSTQVGVSVYGPYERAVIALIELAGKAIDGQSPEIRERIWTVHVKTLENLQAFWDKIFHWGK